MAEGIDKQIVYADVYAHALFELARGKGKIDDYRAELDAVADMVAADPDLAGYLASPAIDVDRRAAFLRKAFDGRISDDLLHALLIMNRNERVGMIAALRRAYVLRQQDAAGEVEVTVTSAVELTAQQKADVEQTAVQASGRKPLMEYVVDDSIVGGLVMQIGDQRFDNSVRRHLEIARGRLRERAERGIRIGVS